MIKVRGKMNTFPRTLKAIREVMREETDDHSASDSAEWELGDALIEECGVDPIWDRDEPPYTTAMCDENGFKGGLKLREVADWLEEQGIDEHNCTPWYLLLHRDMSECFPPERRSMRATFEAHMMYDNPDELDRAMANLPPDTVEVFGSEDSEAHALYGSA
jgi:hypothetical protein